MPSPSTTPLDRSSTGHAELRDLASIELAGQGPQGPVGAQGPAGATGATGPQGPAGPTGAASTVPGPTGPQGPVGPQGTTGTGVRYMGTVSTSSALPTTGNTQGDEYVAVDTYHVWIWNGTAWYDNGPANFGIGPQGPQGPQGVPGPQGPAGTAGVGMPTGSGCDWYATAAPSGYLLCDGSAVSRTSFAALYAILGTVWGAGDGSTTFNLPDCRGRLLVGWAPSGAHADVSALANSDGAALASRRVRHGHTNGVTASPSGLTLPNHSHNHSLSLPQHQHYASVSSLTVGTGVFFSNGGGGGQGGVNSSTDLSAVATSGCLSFPGVNGSVGPIDSAPAINGSVSVGGTIGAGGGVIDTPAYVVVNRIIKT